GGPHVVQSCSTVRAPRRYFKSRVAGRRHYFRSGPPLDGRPRSVPVQGTQHAVCWYDADRPYYLHRSCGTGRLHSELAEERRMTATDTEAMSALHELLDERQRYQGWLATLEGRRSSTPSHVYERVQRDYAGRLDRVMKTLAERAGQLTGTIDAMTAELATLRDQETERTDERHEAELRAAVGEFTPDEWEHRRAEVDGEIERIAAERRSVEDELRELQRIVALTASIEPAATNAAAGDAPATAPAHEAQRDV